MENDQNLSGMIIVPAQPLANALDILAELPYKEVAETIDAIKDNSHPVGDPVAVPEEAPEIPEEDPEADAGDLNG